MPSELYYEFEKFSTNRVKDFSQQILLHWGAGELLKLAAHRYRLYLNLYEYGSDEKRKQINSFDITKRKGAREFLECIFPKKITNALGIDEEPVTYILRHTQLMPRHIITYFNSIIKKENQMKRAEGNEIDPTTISERAIKEGIREVENRLMSEVCQAFSYRYPEAEEVVKRVINELALRFSDGQLHKIFNQHAKKIYKKNEKPHIEFEEFKGMLIEIGCIGAVIEEGEKREEGGPYIKGVFEYTMPGQLDPAHDNELCLHPLFSADIRRETMDDKGAKRVVYPYGTDPEGKDYRVGY